MYYSSLEHTPTMLKKVTLSEVAKLAGVSSSTASLTLSGNKAESISQETQVRVKRAAQQLGYVYKPRKPRTRKGTVTQGDKTQAKRPAIALLVDRISVDDPFIESFKGIREKANENGLMTMIYEVGLNGEHLDQVIERVNQDSVVGVLYGNQTTQAIDPKPLTTCQKPLVLLNCYSRTETLWPTVLPSDLMGGFQATQHLIEQGKTRIAHITGAMHYEAAQERLQGYRRALLSNDIMPDESLILEGSWYFGCGYERTRELLNLESRPDAIFCANDNTAIGCYFALRELGINIPDDIAVIGYDNLLIGSQVIPKLTSMVLPYAIMGDVALELLLTMLSGQKVDNHVVKVKSEIIVRESTVAQ